MKKKSEAKKIRLSEFKDLEAKINKLVKELRVKLKKRRLFLAPMESCTGGGFCNAITNIPGASEIIKGGLVTYSDQEKVAHGIPKKIIEKFSVYSPQTAIVMAYRAIKEIKNSQIGIGITGILSKPDPRYLSKKAGQANIAVIFNKKILVKKIYFPLQKERKKAKSIIILKTLKMIKGIIK